MFILTIETATEVKLEQTVTTRSSSFTLGRDPSCQILLTNTYFSRVHATLTDQGNGSWLVSDGSSQKPSNSGLSIEGRRVIGSALLFEGQTLTLIDQLSVHPVTAKALGRGGDAESATQLLPPSDPIRATLKLLPAEEVRVTRDITLSGVKNSDVEATRINQNLLTLIDKSGEMPRVVEEFKTDICDRLLALESSKASAAMVDEVLTGQLETVKADYNRLTGMLKRKLGTIEGKYRTVMMILLAVLILKLGEGYTPSDWKQWVELLEKVLPLIALFQEMRSKR